MENVITLGKLMGLLLFCTPSSLFFFENSKNTRNELARPVMGTIFFKLACIDAIYEHRSRLKMKMNRSAGKSVPQT